MLGAEIVSGNGDTVLTGLNALAEAGEGDLSFYRDEKYLSQLRSTRASAVLVPLGFSEDIRQTALLAVDNPSFAFGRVMIVFRTPPATFVAGVHPTAVVAASAQFDPEAVSIGPQAVIGEAVKIGAGTEIGAGCFIGAAVSIGEDCKFHAHVSILRQCVVGHRVILHSGAVIGSDGFGFENVGGQHAKIEQVGNVQIDDDVEIGANTCVDRARFGKTWIGAGTKIDNLVQIAHNVVIGKHCLIAGQVGIAGSTRLHDGVIVAAQAGISGHLEIASGVIVTGQSGVSKSLSVPGPYMGFHAQPMRETLRILAATRRLPELIERLRKLEEAQKRDAKS